MNDEDKVVINTIKEINDIYDIITCSQEKRLIYNLDKASIMYDVDMRVNDSDTCNTEDYEYLRTELSRYYTNMLILLDKFKDDEFNKLIRTLIQDCNKAIQLRSGSND